MAWPLSQDYNEAVQNPDSSFADPELRGGEVATNAMGLPMPCSGNFADVYRVNCPASGRTWAVKCFTRQIPGLQERYQQISLHLEKGKPSFIVDFTFLERGIQVRGEWYPILKMQWVEGLTLNQFVKGNLGKPQVLDVLCQLWVKLAVRLQEANIAHCDLQHGNVLLVPGRKGGSVHVRLVDYDGMCVPALTLLKSIEVGHPAYQHPQRLREGIYSLEVDRFSHLVIYTALRSLMVGGKPLWDKYDDGDNLLFKASDFSAPTKSALFHELLKSTNAEVPRLAEAMLQALSKPLDQVPLLEQCAAKVPAAGSGAGSAPARPVLAPVQPSSSRADVFTATAGTTSAPGQRQARRSSNKKSLRALIAVGVGLTVLLGGLLGFAVWRGSKSGSGDATADLSKASTDLQTTGSRRPSSTAARPSEPEPPPPTKPEMKPQTKPAPTPLIVLTPEEERKLAETVVRGVGYLKQTQDADGSWPGDLQHRVAYAALAALTLVECGVSVDDPCVKKATEFIRNRTSKLNYTYELALVLLFLNRLGDGADRDRIQKLALRVVAGQTAAGGWTYVCPVLNDEDHDLLLSLLRDINTRDGDGSHRPQPTTKAPVPPRLSNLAVLQDEPKPGENVFRRGGDDNSNTQFALLALWTARGHHLPVDRSLALVVRRFQTTQHDDGSWDYSMNFPNANMQKNPTMTCAGLFGLAVGRGLAAATRKSGPRAAQDAGIQNALQVVAKKIDPAPQGGKPNPRNRQLDMYFLWSVERVGVLYQLKTIGDKHWYHLGMEQLVKRQQEDGGWQTGGGHGGTRPINTCFAMLFLKQVNFAKDLTDQVTGK